MSALVLSTFEDGVAVLTLNRPERLNAFVDDMRERLAEALDDAAARPDVGALVLTGAGRAFCAGGDVHHMARLRERGAPFEELRPLLERGREVVMRLAALPFPTLAAVNGPAAGAGFHLALACDLRVADTSATFSAGFVRLGLHPDWGGTYQLPRRAGLGHALWMTWTGDPIDAARAERLGWVERVVDDGRALAESLALARRLARAPRTSVRAAKATLRASAHRSLAECLDAEVRAQEACWRDADSAEGLAAFVAKRAPEFGAAPLAVDAPPSRAARRFE